jgi:hypothetical protein
VREQFAQLIKLAFNQIVNERINERLKTALASESTATTDTPAPTSADSPGVEQASEAVVTTSEELEAYHIVRAILREVIDVKRITLRDVQTYCGILLDDTNRKPICRLHFNRTQKYIGFFAGQSDNAKESQKEQRVPIADIDEIYTFAERLKATVIHYEDGEHKRSKQTA